MWLYAFYATGFLHLTSAVLEKHNNAREEAIFADVIRNISRVNNVLQELISNYEQLQKIYKSHENTEEDYSSDTEIDEVFKSMKKVKIDHKKNAKFTSTIKPTNAGSFPATKMIWSDNSDDDDVDDISKEKDQTETASRLPKTEGLQAEHNAFKDDTFENTSSDSTESMRNTSITKPKEAKIIFIDTHKKIEAIKENIKMPSFNIENTTKKPKTRYNKVSKNNKAKMKARNSKPNKTLKISNDNKYIKKVIYAEKFSPKSIWKEIINNKPIKLEPQYDITYDTPKKRSGNNPKTSIRNDAGKTALVIVTNNNLKGIKSKEKDTLESPEDKTIAKEIFKTNVLRHAYGDACSKVVVKKCYKACKHAGKSYCTLYKCKSEFKSKFKELSKAGCIREFLEPTSNKSDMRYRGQEDVFIDATRDRFFDAACLPHVESRHKKPITRNDTAHFKTKPLTRYDKTINILRDRYERACQKASARKCTSACNYAYTNTCDTFKCEKKKRKNFKKYCKQQCQILYKAASDYDSSDSDSSSISSETNTS